LKKKTIQWRIFWSHFENVSFSRGSFHVNSVCFLNFKKKSHTAFFCKKAFYSRATFKSFLAFYLQKIWCASWARVNLPHIGNRICIKFVLYRNLLKMQRSTFSEFEWEVPVKYQNSEFLFLFLDAEIVTKTGIIFVIRWNLLNKTQVLTFLSRNLCKRYP
jgi:hypothetical protein